MRKIDIIRQANAKVKQILKERENEGVEREDDLEATKLAIQLQIKDAIVEAINKTAPDNEKMAELFQAAVEKVRLPDVNVPEIKLPVINVPESKISVDIPEIKIPPISVPKPEVTVNVPPQKAPIVNLDVPETIFPDFMDVGLGNITPKTPLHVMPVDAAGKLLAPSVGGGGGTAGTKQIVDAINNGSKADEKNSTETLLGGNDVFTGEAVEVLHYSSIAILIHTDVPGTMSVQFSGDATDWHGGESYTLLGGSTKFFTPPTQSRYYRLVYTNGPDPQSEFHVHTVLKRQPMKWSSHNIDDPINDQDDAELVKAVITGSDPDGTYRNVKTTVDGNLTISDTSSGLSIARGNVTGHTFIHKFGDAPDFDTGDNEVTIWDGANDALLGGGAMAYTYSATDDIGLLSSSSISDTVNIEIQGILSDGTLSTQTFTLNGQTDVDLSATGTDFKRVFRMRNVGATDLVGTVYLRTNGSGQSSGVPSTANTVRAIIGIGNNQTLMSIYTIPTGKTGYMRSFFASSAGAKKDTNYIIRVKARPLGEVFQLKHKTAIVTAGTSHFQHQYIEPTVFTAGTDIEITAQITEATITEADVAAGFDIVLVDN